MMMDNEAVKRFAWDLRSRGKQPSTVESYARDAQRFMDYLRENRLTPKMVESDTLIAFQNHLRDECTERENSIRRTVIGIRQFFRYLSEAGEISMTPFDGVAIPSRDESLPSPMTDADIEALLSIAEGSPHPVKAARDCAIVALLAFEGLKAGELINLEWPNFIVHEPQIDRDNLNTNSDPGPKATPLASLSIGGNKARSIRLSQESSLWLRRYREKFEILRSHPIIERSSSQRIFVAFKGRDAATPIPEMTRHGLKFILYDLGNKSGLSRLNTEQLRHFAVAHLIEIGRSSEEIMMHLGLKRLGNIAKHLALTKVPLAEASSEATPTDPSPGTANHAPNS